MAEHPYKVMHLEVAREIAACPLLSTQKVSLCGMVLSLQDK